MKYLDTVTESTDRLKEARNNINKGILFLLFAFVISFILGVFSIFFSYSFSLLCYTGAICYLVLMIGLILKREIYSLAILIKEK